MKSVALFISFFGGTALMIWLGIHFGTKYIDKMLCLPKRDPNDPIVLPSPKDHF